MIQAKVLRREQSAPPGSDTPVRVMVVDDSALVRSAFASLIKRETDLRLAAVAASAEQALEMLAAARPDVILLDLEMPGMGGLEALPRLIAAAPAARIMVVSTLTVVGAEATLKALSLGAADTLAKPQSGGFDDDYRMRLLMRLRALGRTAGKARRPRPETREQGPVRLRALGRKPVHALAIGASTGGIHALGQLLGALPARIGMPILITQHLPPAFMDAFCRQLSAASGRDALVAADGMALIADRIFVAPGDAHMAVRRESRGLIVRLDRMPVANGCMPSVDPMFASLSEALEGCMLGVVLSGMGRDGSEGAMRIVADGGTVLAQDEQSSAVWGMPGAVAKAGLASAILAPDQLAARVPPNTVRAK